MILEFTVTNYRSIREPMTLSLIAEGYKSKDMNVFQATTANGGSERLLKLAALWGPNASGKTNLFRALVELVRLVRKPPHFDEGVPCYDPFLFDAEAKNAPTVFRISFIGKDQVPFEYEISFSGVQIETEILSWFPKGQKSNCFTRRRGDSENIHIGILGAGFGKKKHEIYKNRPFLSQFGSSIPDEIIGSVYSYFGDLVILNATSSESMKTYKRIASELIHGSKHLQEQVNQFISGIDLQISGWVVKEMDAQQITLPTGFPREALNRLLSENRFQVFGKHKVFLKGDEIGEHLLSLEEQSSGTQALFTLAVFIFRALKAGSPLFIDELDTSLHPEFAATLLKLFHSDITNPLNAQLVFTTHDTSLMDEHLLRREQIWFTEKDQFGGTELYSLQDIEGVREDSRFERSYRAGKFSAYPESRNIESMFS